jgi:tetratricopeptide (TPR) repeat protein
LALIYQFRALSLRQLAHTIDRKLVANNLFGIANAHWGQQNLPEALSYAQQALTLNESIESENDSNIATNLAVLANIYHAYGDDIRALELAKRALILLERCESPESLGLALLLNNIGIIQLSVGLFNDALLTFIRVLQICEKSVPEGHPKLVAISNDIHRFIERQQHNGLNSFSYLWTFLSKILIL